MRQEFLWRGLWWSLVYVESGSSVDENSPGAASCSRQTQLLCNSVLSVLMWMWNAEGCSQGGSSWSQLQQVSCGFTSVTWTSNPSDRTAEGMGGQSVVGGDRNNKGTVLCEFIIPFHGYTGRNSVPYFYFSHISHKTCLIMDESVRPWGQELLFVFLPSWKVSKGSQRCYCNRKYVYLMNSKHCQHEYLCSFFLCRK